LNIHYSLAGLVSAAALISMFLLGLYTSRVKNWNEVMVGSQL